LKKDDLLKNQKDPFLGKIITQITDHCAEMGIDPECVGAGDACHYNRERVIAMRELLALPDPKPGEWCLRVAAFRKVMIAESEEDIREVVEKITASA
jgi:hypothetical protein